MRILCQGCLQCDGVFIVLGVYIVSSLNYEETERWYMKCLHSDFYF